MRRKADSPKRGSIRHRIFSVFFRTIDQNYYSVIEYEPTKLTLGLAAVLTLVGNIGLAYLVMSALGGFDMSYVSWMSPVFGMWWLDVIFVIIGAVFLCGSFHRSKGKPPYSDVAEHVQWMVDKEKKARDERILYDEYKKIYKSLDRLICFRVDHMKAGAWDEMNSQLREVYDALSLHAMRRDLPLSQEIKRYTGTDEFEKLLLAQVRNFGKEIDDLIELWSSQYGFNGLTLYYSPLKDEDGIERFARLLGMETFLETYYEGVPVEDILA